MRRPSSLFLLLALASGCGRLGYGTQGLGGDASMDSARPEGGPADSAAADTAADAASDTAIAADGETTDGSTATLACADFDIGARTGVDVHSGDTSDDDDDIGTCGAGREELVGFAAPATSSYLIRADSSAFTPQVAVRTGDCAGPEVACDAAPSSGTPGDATSQVIVDLDAGVPVAIVVSDALAEGGGPYRLRIEPVDCAGDLLIAGVPFSGSGTTAGTSRFGGSCGGQSAPEVTYRLTLPDTGQYDISTSGSAYDTLLYVRADSCRGAELACNDDVPGGGGTSSGSGDLTSIVTIDREAGQEVFIVVDGLGTDAGDFTLSVTYVGAGG